MRPAADVETPPQPDAGAAPPRVAPAAPPGDAPPAAAPATHAVAAPATSTAVRGVELQEVTVCIPLGEGQGVAGVRVTVRGRGVERRAVRFCGAAEGAPPPGSPPKARRRQGLVVALLPKSQYMLRILEVPRVLPHEVPAMLRLEVAASLPPEMGSVEISYRRVAARKEGYERYEAYAARRDDLDQFLAALAACGVSPDVLLPSAAAWVAAAHVAAEPHLLVADFGGGQLEAASVAGDQTVNLRPFRRPGGDEAVAAGDRILAECVRSLVTTPAAADGPVVVAWLAGVRPEHLLNGMVTFRDVGDAAVVGGRAGDDVERLLALMATAVAGCQRSVLAAANLLPVDVARRQRRRTVRRTAVTAGLCLAASLALAYASLHGSVRRSRARAADLSSQIARIKTEGDAVGRRLEQLEAVRKARLRRADYTRVVTALAEATPAEVSYSSVELSESGQIRLQGQASSLSLPFQLPERLQAQPLFADVMLQDAGQAKKGDGSIAEFRINCRLKREGGR